MERLVLKFVGRSSLLMHSERGADPLDKDVRALKKLSNIRKKTDQNHEEMARIEFGIALYYADDLGVFVPTANLRKSIINGAELSKLGMTIKRGTMLDDDRAKLVYDGPKTPDELWAAQTFCDRRSVVVGTARVMRTRPIFRPVWSLTFALLFDPGAVQQSQIVESAQAAGRMVGIGDYRPNCSGWCGRYGVEVVE